MAEEQEQVKATQPDTTRYPEKVDKKLAEDIERAKRYADVQLEYLHERKKAPKGLTLGDTLVDETIEMRERLLPDSFWRDADNHIVGPPNRAKMIQNGGKPPSGMKPPRRHAFFGDKNLHQSYIARGYVPVVDPITHEQAQHAGDPMYWLPQELYEASVGRQGKESSDRLKEAVAAGKDGGKSDVLDAAADSRMQKAAANR
jgi:hypothetical protein